MHNLIFISVQPDEPYFHWQVEVMLNNFLDKRVNGNNIDVLFSTRKEPSEAAKKLAGKYPFVRFFFYPETFGNNRGYIPIMRLNALKQHFLRFKEEFKEKAFFYHDSDIIFRELPDFEALMSDGICYVSDTVSYIGAEYIKSKGNGVYEEMCKIVNISEHVPVLNEKNSGGAQYLLKGIDYIFWEKVEKDCLDMYQMMFEKENEERKYLMQKEPEKLGKYNPVQKWCSDMWSVLWNLWYFGYKVQISKELDFCWATSHINEYYNTKIFHNAGVVNANNPELFFKGAFIEKSPFNEDIQIPEKYASFHYVQAINSVKNKQALTQK